MRIAPFLLTASILCAGAAAHAMPHVTGSSPVHMVGDLDGAPSVHMITLYGDGFSLPTTTGTTLFDDVKVWAIAPGHEWTIATRTDPWVRLDGWNPSQLDLSFIGLPPGTLTIYVQVGGVFSNPYTVPVRELATYAPRINQPAGTTVTAHNPGELVAVQVDGLNDVDSTCFWLDGSGMILIHDLDPYDGTGSVVMPDVLPGDHRIWVSNHGCGRWAHWSGSQWISALIDWSGIHGPHHP